MEDRRSTAISDDPAQRRDLILMERALAGDLDAFNDLVVCYQDFLFALVVRMVPDRDQASDAVQEAFFSAYRHMRAFRGGSVRSWLSRIAINAAMDAQRLKKRRPADPYPELDDDTWQPPAPATDDPVTNSLEVERHRVLDHALAHDHAGPAKRDRPLRCPGFRLRRDRLDDGRLPRDREVADPSRPSRPARPARRAHGPVPWLIRGRTGSSHATHDLELIARVAAGDGRDVEARRGRGPRRRVRRLPGARCRPADDRVVRPGARVSGQRYAGAARLPPHARGCREASAARRARRGRHVRRASGPGSAASAGESVVASSRSESSGSCSGAGLPRSRRASRRRGAAPTAENSDAKGPVTGAIGIAPAATDGGTLLNGAASTTAPTSPASTARGTVGFHVDERPGARRLWSARRRGPRAPAVRRAAAGAPVPEAGFRSGNCPGREPARGTARPSIEMTEQHAGRSPHQSRDPRPPLDRGVRRR